jgi:hypothetical protein
MKTRILLAMTVLIVLGLAVAAVAYTRTSLVEPTTMACCKDSCPMKSKDKNAGEKKECCDKPDCCCKGDSCPMKNKDAKNAEKSDAKTCCCKHDGHGSKHTDHSV